MAVAIRSLAQRTLTDHLNTVRDIAKYNSQTDTTTVVNHLVYDAFGKVTSETNPAVDSLFLFTARPFDQDSQLQNNLNRWYDARVGRWLSEDPVGFAAGDGNLYRYVLGIPLTNADPNGLGIQISADCILVSERTTGVWRFCDYNCVEDTSVERVSVPKGGTDDLDNVPRPLTFRYSTSVFRWCPCPVTRRLNEYLYSSYTPPLKDCSREECLKEVEKAARRMSISCEALIAPAAKRACKAAVRAWLEAVKPTCNWCKRP